MREVFPLLPCLHFSNRGVPGSRGPLAKTRYVPTRHMPGTLMFLMSVAQLPVPKCYGAKCPHVQVRMLLDGIWTNWILSLNVIDLPWPPILYAHQSVLYQAPPPDLTSQYECVRRAHNAFSRPKMYDRRVRVPSRLRCPVGSMTSVFK